MFFVLNQFIYFFKSLYNILYSYFFNVTSDNFYEKAENVSSYKFNHKINNIYKKKKFFKFFLGIKTYFFIFDTLNFKTKSNFFKKKINFFFFIKKNFFFKKKNIKNKVNLFKEIFKFLVYLKKFFKKKRINNTSFFYTNKLNFFFYRYINKFFILKNKKDFFLQFNALKLKSLQFKHEFLKVKLKKIYTFLSEPQVSKHLKVKKINWSPFNTSGNIIFHFIRKNNIYNKGRYSRNKQNYRTGVFLCIWLTVLTVIGLYFYFYFFLIKFTYFYFLFFIFIFSFCYKFYFKLDEKHWNMFF